MAPPRLVPVPPTQGEPVTVDRSPFWIGSGGGSALRVFLPGIGEKHASITEREDGHYLTPIGSGPGVEIDGSRIGAATKLADGAVIALGPAARYEFVTGAPRAKPAEPASEPEYAPMESRSRRRWWRRRRGPRSTRVGFPLWGWLAIALIVGAVGYGGWVLVRTLRSARSTPATPPPLTEVEGRIYDSLMVEATRNIERGATLLDLGLNEAALRQFAEGITLFEASPIASNEWVRRSINSLSTVVREIYRSKKTDLPPGLRLARGTTIDLSRTLGANLTADEFLAAVATVRSGFEATYAKPFVITGQDHAEHLSLYGARSAMDVRVRDLTREQVSFLIEAFRRIGVRVKDFSTDLILQAQIAAARAKGWNDRAGTGLHLHIDRFRDRSDRWTVR